MSVVRRKGPGQRKSDTHVLNLTTSQLVINMVRENRECNKYPKFHRRHHERRDLLFRRRTPFLRQHGALVAQVVKLGMLLCGEQPGAIEVVSNGVCTYTGAKTLYNIDSAWF